VITNSLSLQEKSLRQWQQLEITRRVLGEEYPNTSLSALNPVVTLLNMGDVAAIDILKKRLLEGSDRLEANQQKIREMIIQTIQQIDKKG